MKIIAHIRCDFKEKFGIPRQSGLAPVVGRIVFTEEYRDPAALRGIEGYSHLWLIWEFSEAKREKFSPSVRPPRLGGNTRMGVFATRSPFRPNPIGLSSVRLLAVEKTQSEGTVLVVEGADLLDGTPILDIKPYLAYTDSHPEAVSGFADGVKDYALKVDFPEDLLSRIPEEKRKGLLSALAGDPRPSYKPDGGATYGMRYGDFEIAFSVRAGVLTVEKVEKCK